MCTYEFLHTARVSLRREQGTGQVRHERCVFPGMLVACWSHRFDGTKNVATAISTVLPSFICLEFEESIIFSRNVAIIIIIQA